MQVAEALDPFLSKRFTNVAPKHFAGHAAFSHKRRLTATCGSAQQLDGLPSFPRVCSALVQRWSRDAAPYAQTIATIERKIALSLAQPNGGDGSRGWTSMDFLED